VATDAQSAARDLERLHLAIIDVVVNRAAIYVYDLCRASDANDLYVLLTTWAPYALTLH
jgi:hypothetical protein